MERNKRAVIGLGNRLLADEGAGLHAVALLKERLPAGKTAAGIDLIEAGTPGPALMHQLDGREKIVFIDAGNCGLAAGQYRRFLPDEAISLKKSKNYSLHQFDLITFLEFAGRMGLTEKIDVVIYCIQAAEIAMSEKLSPVVAKNLPFLVRDVCRELEL